MHDEDRRGFRTLCTVVERLRQRDPAGERTRWRTCSEITTYACALALQETVVEGTTITIHLPVHVPELTVRLRDVEPRGISVNGEALREARTRRAFADGAFYREGAATLLACTPPTAGTVTIMVQTL